MGQQIEHTEQSKFITFCRVHGGLLGEIFAIPNGAHVSKREAAKLKREGVRSGPSDLCLPIRSHDRSYPILWIEFKRPDGKGVISNDQAEFMENRRLQGHQAVVVLSAVEAIILIMWYAYGQKFNTVEALALLNRAMSCPA
jgi:hypothetical protein